MTNRKGLGKGQGKGFLNLIPKDPYIHSLSAKGIKSTTDTIILPKGVKTKFGIIPTERKRGLIREIARKVVDGVDWAVQWEKEHLPQQANWVKKEYEKGKDLAIRGLEKAEDFIEQKKADLDDVRDELDTDDDGVQDLSMQELEDTNVQIKNQLDEIDLDKDNIPDYKEVEDGKESSIGFLFPKAPEIKEEFEIEIEDGDGVAEPKKKSIIGTGLQTIGKGVSLTGEVVGRKIQEEKAVRKVLHEMSDGELRKKAISEGKSIFGGSNKYEKELIKREQRKAELSQKLKEARQISKKKESATGGIALGFLNPLNPSGKKR